MDARRGSVLRYVFECRLPGRVEPALYARQIPKPRRMRQIVRHRPNACEEWQHMRGRVGESVLDGLRWRRRLAVQYRRLEVEKRGDELLEIVPAPKRRHAYEPLLKAHPRVAKQP